MKKGTRRLTFCAMITAFSIVFLYASVLMPTLSLTLAAIAGLLPAAVILRHGLPAGLLTYIACAALALILVPEKEGAIVYTFVFGYYPVVKALIERVGNMVLEWIMKLAVFNIAFFALYFLFFTVFMGYYGAFNFGVQVFAVLANIAFIIYDIGFSKLIVLYERKIARHIK